MPTVFGTGSFVLEQQGAIEVRVVAVTESGLQGVSPVDSLQVTTRPVDYEMSMSAVLGSPEDVFLRLIYGTVEQQGVPTGIFYDLRALPLPFMPGTKTPISVVFATENIGKQHEFTITREQPTDDRPSTETFLVTPTLDTQTGTLRIGLTTGLNIVTVTVDNVVVYTWQCVARNYATVLSVIAEAINTGVTEPLQSLAESLYSHDSTRFMDVFQGSVRDLFPDNSVLNRMISQLWVSGRMNNPGATGGVLDVAAFTGSTPWLTKTDHTWDPHNPWLQPLLSHSARIDREMRVWAPTEHEGRWHALTGFALASDQDVATSESHVIVNNEQHVLLVADNSDQLRFPEPEEWAELTIQ